MKSAEIWLVKRRFLQTWRHYRMGGWLLLASRPWSQFGVSGEGLLSSPL